MELATCKLWRLSRHRELFICDYFAGWKILIQLLIDYRDLGYWYLVQAHLLGMTKHPRPSLLTHTVILQQWI